MEDPENVKSTDCPIVNQPIVLHAKAHDVNGKIEWGLGLNPDPPPRFVVNLDLARNSGEHKVIIHLAGNANGITFAEADPIWVTENGSCPPPPGSTSAQIKNIQCNDRMLTFEDSNDGKERVLTYQLNFTGPGATPLDPMIRNGGSV